MCNRSIILILIVTTGPLLAYHRNWGPIIGNFQSRPMQIVNKCEEKNGNVCLEIPSKKICKEKLAKPLSPCQPLPWWYFYCQWLMTPKGKPRVKTTSSTIHPYYRKTLDEVNQYKKTIF